MDLPRCGNSKAISNVSSQDDVLQMLLEFIERVLADQRFAVVGESRGSYHARGIVFKRPESVDGMMLLGAGGMTKDAQSRLPEHETIVRDQIPPPEMTEDETARYEGWLFGRRTSLSAFAEPRYRQPRFQTSN